jgi:hypothetical protein
MICGAGGSLREVERMIGVGGGTFWVGEGKVLRELKLLPSGQKNLSAGETKVSRWLRKALALRMNLTDGESRGMGPETGFLGLYRG